MLLLQYMLLCTSCYTYTYLTTAAKANGVGDGRKEKRTAKGEHSGQVTSKHPPAVKRADNNERGVAEQIASAMVRKIIRERQQIHSHCNHAMGAKNSEATRDGGIRRYGTHPETYLQHIVGRGSDTVYVKFKSRARLTGWLSKQG